jgi:hypothetical protein
LVGFPDIKNAVNYLEPYGHNRIIETGRQGAQIFLIALVSLPPKHYVKETRKTVSVSPGS